MPTNSPPTVLVVDDESAITDMYALWLEDDYTVHTASDGNTALERISADTDVVLLDRRMPDLAGEEVLATIRDRDYDCRVAMVTGVTPNADVIEMGFDDYLVKPVDEDDLHETVEALVRRANYDRRSRELFALSSKRAALRTEGEDTAAVEDAIDELDDQIKELNEQSISAVSEFNTNDFRAVFRDVTIPEEQY